MANARMTRKPTARGILQGIIQRLLSLFGNLVRGNSADFNQLLFIVVAMIGIGYLMVVSSSSVDMAQMGTWWKAPSTQLAACLAGLFFMALAATGAVEKTRVNYGLIWGIMLAAQALVLWTGLGVEVNGNKNWLNLYIFNLQPSEFLKIGVIVLFARFFSDSRKIKTGLWNDYVEPMVIAGVSMVMIFLGGDAGTDIVLAATLFGFLYLYGIRRDTVRNFLLLGMAGALGLYAIGGSRRARIDAWLHPDAPDPFQLNWQVTHAKWAFASGGIFGQGLGNSQMKWSWLPEAQNDFIFAIVGEETGIIGALGVIGLFVYLGLTLGRIARKCPPGSYEKLVVQGIMLWIMIQAFINISVVLGILPVLGVNLPLISYGGSSMVATLAAIGIVLGIERQNSQRTKLTVVRGGIR